MKPFAMFDFTPVGIGVALAGLSLPRAGLSWLLPRDRQGSTSPRSGARHRLRHGGGAIPEGRGAGRQDRGRSQEAGGGGGRRRVAILREGKRNKAPLPDASLRAGDVILEGEPKALERVVAEGRLDLVGQHRPTEAEARSTRL